MSVTSPLGALGAIVVLIQGIAAGALVAVRSDPILQRVLIITISIVTLLFALFVTWLVAYLAIRKPWYLFNPKDIDPGAHSHIYGPIIPTLGVGIKATLAKKS